MDPMDVLVVEDVVKKFPSPEGGQALVVDVPRFALADGRQIALRGSSGSGKTTFLNLIAGILRCDAGRIVVAGTEIASLGESARDAVRAKNIGYVFQTFNLLQGYTALENVILGRMFGAGPDAAFAGELLDRVGLKDRMKYRPGQLSVGQQQRVALARALANRPRLVLADEPTGSLDPHHAREALGLLRELCAESGAALLLVSHDPGVLAQFEEVQEFAAINRAMTAGGGGAP
jgi:putative ABC transport system ATP-binding protein